MGIFSDPRKDDKVPSNLLGLSNGLEIRGSDSLSPLSEDSPPNLVFRGHYVRIKAAREGCRRVWGVLGPVFALFPYIMEGQTGCFTEQNMRNLDSFLKFFKTEWLVPFNDLQVPVGWGIPDGKWALIRVSEWPLSRPIIHFSMPKF